MAVIFVSHSSRDDSHATRLEQWLHSNGFTDVFVDHEVISGGDKWRDELRKAASSCRVVMCIVTGDWLASSECFNEFMAAWYMGRRVVPLMLLPATAFDEEAGKRLQRILSEDQGIDLKGCLDGDGVLDLSLDDSLAKRLAAGLRAAGANTRIGLDPTDFAIDRNLRESPFPGLTSYGDDDADAALFYGRSREIAQVLQDLRSMRALNDKRPLVIQGASGAGKSSLLKAGVIPRLRRETPAWLPLRAFRPGADPLLNFAAALCRSLHDYGQQESPGVLRDRLRAAWEKADRVEGILSPQGFQEIQTVIEVEGARLRTAANRPGSSILISVDQAEELVLADNLSGQALADYLRAAFTSTESHWPLAFTIRTDSFPLLQKHRHFMQLEARGYDLRAIPTFRFESVVQAPAKRYGAEVEVALVDALMEDAPKDDSLPLLAFALQRLWEQYGTSGKLTETHYTNFGGLSGLIEDAAERALQGLEPSRLNEPLPPQPLARLLKLGHATFIPAMVQITDHGVTRRTPLWNSFSEDSRELLERFERWRLVVRKGREEEDGGVVEVAHEALFRNWKRLAGWIVPEKARLEALRYLQLDAKAWRDRKEDVAYLNHRQSRLAEAELLISDSAFTSQISDLDRRYLTACRAAQRRARARASGSVAAALIVSLAIAGVAWWQQDWLVERYNWYSMGPKVVPSSDEAMLASQPGREFEECRSGCPRMVVLPKGAFEMGTEDESDSERPQQRVYVEKPFAMGKTEVTVAQWRKCEAAGACAKVLSIEASDDLPVVGMRWDQAQQYVAWLSRMTGKLYRLPTEAEWEYAARARSTRKYSSGDDEAELEKIAWFAENADDRRHPVAQKPANAFGLHDMHGNVLEFCEDGWHASYSGRPAINAAVWTGGQQGQHVVRGGAFRSMAKFVRVTNRAPQDDTEGSPEIGFRVVRTLDDGGQQKPAN